MNNLKFFTVKQYPGFVFVENEYAIFALKKNEKVEWKELIFVLPLRDAIYLNGHKKIAMSPHKVLTELSWPVSLSDVVEKLETEEALPEIALY